jgi:gamma-glutamyltranspeptidase
MVFGVMGGNMQPQGHLQFVMNYVYDHLNPQACSEAQAEVERQYTLEAKQNIMPADSDDEVEVFKPCSSV